MSWTRCKWPLECRCSATFVHTKSCLPLFALHTLAGWKQSLLTLAFLSHSASQTVPASRCRSWTRSSRPQRWSSGCSPFSHLCSSPNTTITPTSSLTAQWPTTSPSTRCSSCHWVLYHFYGAVLNALTCLSCCLMTSVTMVLLTHLCLTTDGGRIHKVVHNNSQFFVVAEYRPFQHKRHITGLNLDSLTVSNSTASKTISGVCHHKKNVK